jgi:2-polyprenyl-6-methoxyphenol hydroxylase-like FAD-dependent oxidoreductase
VAEIVVIGGGIVGLTAAMLLAQDQHRVTVLERDAAEPPEDSHAAWLSWDRRSVAQFRQVHYFQPRFRSIIERELPEALGAVKAAGALRISPLEIMPPKMSGGWRDGDDRFHTFTGRRPAMERAFAAAASASDGLDVRRGVVVRGLIPAAPPGEGGVPHVIGVETDDGAVTADLVVDASGRRSALPAWLAAIGARAPHEELETRGFAYYTRHFRSADGSVPAAIGPPLQPYGSISLLTLAADNGTWGLGIVASGKDKALRAASAVPVWNAIVARYPLVAHWLDGEPLTGVDTMANLPDRLRKVVVDGEPVVTGVVPVADAWGCTNPSVGRGITLGTMHAVELREAIRDVGVADGRSLALRFEERAAREVEPWYRDTLQFDRHRLAEIEADMAGRTYTSDEPSWSLGRALAASVQHDPDLLRSYLEIVTVQTRGVEVLARPGIAQKALRLATYETLPGPDRTGLEAIIASATR